MRNGKDVDPELMKKMNEKLSHRGPDGSDIWCEGPVGLGHQMLWTTQESLHEKLPFEENGLIITADARIDNRDELSKDLGLRDEEDVSDSYFILKAYQEWGEECPDKLLGDFAFAIWDRENERLFCARDHMGVKPFYYYLSNNRFLFTTEIKALFNIPEVPYKLNELQLAFYLSGIYDERSLTFYKDIFRLPSAHYMTIDNKKSKIRRYWKLDPNLETILDSDEEYTQKFLEIFTESVRCRLRSLHPIGFELSGGLDSSSIVCVAKSILKKNDNDTQINTFSQVYNDIKECDESYYINKIIDLGGINPYYLDADQISPLNEIGNILWYLEEPFFANNRHSFWILYKNMQKKGTRVLLTGMDGDTTVSHGHNYLKELATTFKWKKLINEINTLSTQFNKDIPKIILNKLILPMAPESIVKWWVINIHKNPRVMFNNTEFVNKLDFKNYSKPYRKFNFTAKNTKEYHYMTLINGIHQSLLEVLDRNTAPFSIEPRHPFYDKRLIEFCYSIPTEQKIRSGWGRWLLRNTMEDILPREVQWRHDKINFAPVRDRNLILFEKEYLDKLIYKNSEILKDYIDLDEFKAMYEKYKSRSKGYNHKLIEKLVLVIIWLEHSEL